MTDPNRDPIPRRKRDHVDLVVDSDVAFRTKTAGFERYEFVHNALPEIDYDRVDTSATFLGVPCSFPLIVSSMTGGYAEAEEINRSLGAACEELKIAMGVGSQRQALEDSRFHASFRAAREAGPTVPLFGNIGAAELAGSASITSVQRLADLIQADGFAVHLNPLQELMQPEGNPRFSGVLRSMETLNRDLGIPVIVKEVGAGLSGDVVQRLVDVGIRIVDVAGAGGTSWAGVEILRRDKSCEDDDYFWEWGIPTAEAIAAARPICETAGVKLIASGGITRPSEMASSIALGAHMTGVARPVLARLKSGGVAGVITMLTAWKEQLRRIMFLTGSPTIDELRFAPLRIRRGSLRNMR